MTNKTKSIFRAYFGLLGISLIIVSLIKYHSALTLIVGIVMITACVYWRLSERRAK